MTRLSAILASAMLACAVAPAATISTTLSVTNATLTLGLTASISGPVTLTTIGSGTFSAPTLTADSSGNYNGAFTITLAGADRITGTLKIPASALTALATGGTPTGSATVTGGAGTYAGATGSFATLTGSGSIGATGILVSFSGAGTITTGGSGPPTSTAPVITAVQDAASNTTSIAQGSIFIVKGSNLSASGYTPFSPPRPTISSGVKVTFTPVAGGTGTDAFLVYLYNQSGVNQIACILPSTVAVGSYNVTVTNGTVSAPLVASVVASKAALFTQDSSGSGLASVQNFISAGVVDLNRLTTGSVSGITISPAKPGQPVIAYGTGLGAYAAGDNTASPLFDFRSTATIVAVVGGVNIPVDYAGRAGYAGEDQINFTLPANIPTGCAVSLQISVNGKLSVPTSISIAPDANATACVIPGYTTQQLQKLDQGGTIIAGAFAIEQFSITVPSVGAVKSNSIAGGFTKLTGFQLASAAQGNVSVIQAGSCQVIQATSGGTSATSGGSLTYLDAGTVSITGPAGSSLTNAALKETNNSYGLSSTEGFAIPGQASFSLPGGTYSLSGAGGTDVGTFSASLNLGSPLTVTGGLPASIPRISGLTINWTGGNSSDSVEIIGSSSTTTGTGSTAVTNTSTFICLTTAGQQTFTVPASILQQLPATTGTNTGLLEVASGTTPTSFTASLKAGGSIDAGAFLSFVGVGAQVTYQ